ncbi:putative reverse transcriptase zinc-binding domain-containing protein [Helianthus anomalus]
MQVIGWSWRSPLESTELLDSLGLLDVLLNDLQITPNRDSWKWAADSEGCFSVKSVKTLLKSEDNQEPCFILEWCKWVPAKCNIHVWRSGLNSIPTVEALTRRNVHVEDSLCSFCRESEETAEHIFISCISAAIVWNHIST